MRSLKRMRMMSLAAMGGGLFQFGCSAGISELFVPAVFILDAVGFFLLGSYVNAG